MNPSTPPLNETTEKINWRLLLPLFLVVAIDSMGMGIVLPLLPFYGQHFGATNFEVSLLFMVFSLCQVIASPLLGRWSDKIGRKPVLIFSQIGSLISMACMALAGNFLMVAIARMINGITAGNISVAAAYAVDASSPNTRKQAIGFVGAGIGVGLVIGPALSAFSSHWALSAPLWIATALSLVSLLANIFFLPKDTPQDRNTKKEHMPIETWLFTPAVFATLALASLFYLATSLFVTGLGLYLQHNFTWNGHPFGPQQLGWIFVGTGFINILVQMGFIRWIGKKMSDAYLIACSFFIMLISYFSLEFIPSVGLLALVLGVGALGSALLRPSISAILSLCVPPTHQGAIMGANQSVMAVSNVIGPLIAGLLLNANLYNWWIFVMSAILFIATIATLIISQLRVWPETALKPITERNKKPLQTN